MSLAPEIRTRFLRFLLRPALRFCVKHALKIQDLLECAKVEFVQAACEELAARAKKNSQSLISVITGLRRREVQRLLQGVTKLDRPQHLVAKVLGRWRDDRRFNTRSGSPRVLSVGSEDGEFNELVRLVSTDLNPSAVLFELERVGAVERTAKGVTMVHENFIPRHDIQAGLNILSQDAIDLSATVEANLSAPQKVPHHHLRTEYDCVRADQADELRRAILREGHEFHLKMRALVAQYDQEVNPDPQYHGEHARVVVSSFSFDEVVSDSSAPVKTKE